MNFKAGYFEGCLVYVSSHNCFGFLEPPKKLTNIKVGNFTHDAAVVTWDKGEYAQSYHIHVSPVDPVIGEFDKNYASVCNDFIITNLRNNTEYQVTVKAIIILVTARVQPARYSRLTEWVCQ